MLVLSCKLDETIEIASGDVVIKLLRIDRNKVRIGITAPQDILVLRGDLAERQRRLEGGKNV